MNVRISLTERLCIETNGASLDEQRFPGRQGRVVFAYLAAQGGRPVPRDELAELLWDDNPPATWEKALRVLMTKLRSLLEECGIDGSTALTSAFGCYALTLPAGTWIDVDAAADTLLRAERALAAGDLREAHSEGSVAAELARRSFLPGQDGSWVEGRRRDQHELLVRSLECLNEASFGAKDFAQAARHAEEVIELEPFRESCYRLLMEAHAAAGNRADALRAYERCRRLLADELGAYPSPETDSIYRELLAAPSSPAAENGSSPASQAPPETPPPTKAQRKTITVLLCDVAHSSAPGVTIDPEALQARVARFFQDMRAIVARYDGTAEQVIGDAVMAVFGLPVVHENDALRAVRAAEEARAALAELGLAGRIGVMTGEVVTGDGALTGGEVVSLAKRMVEAAAPGEVLIGQPTLALVRTPVDTEPVEALMEDNGVHRLLRVRDEAEARPGGPFVGRKAELSFLRDTWDLVRSDGRCELVTVVGEAGVGKSRLAAEFRASIEATVVGGRCPPYGEGITYLPVVEVLTQLDLRPEDEAAAAAISSLLGETDTPTSADEIAWAVRRVLAQAAAERPLLVLFDDLQWGEEAFLGLVEQAALLSSDSPILLLCLARPELTERRPSWPVALRLGTLDDEEVDELIRKRVPADVRARIARAAGGNPLFVEEMLAVVGEADADIPVPPTLQALLATRLDQLESAERTVLEGAAIEGEVFHRGAVQALAPDLQVTTSLASLVRKGLVKPERAHIRGEDSLRFHHILIRDAAYNGLPKATRAQLHQRFAAWLDRKGGDLVELDEIVGYHLEQSDSYRSELGLPADPELREEARRRLQAAGQRAGRRQDFDAAISLLQRAAALVPESEIDFALELELGEVLSWKDRSEESIRRADALVQRASAAGDSLAELCATVHAGRLRALADPDGKGRAVRLDDFAALVEEALPVIEAAGDPMALYIAYCAQTDLEDARGHNDLALAAFERAVDNVGRAGYRPFPMLGQLVHLRFNGSIPVPEFLAWLDEVADRAGPDQFVRGFRGWSLAKLGRFDEARAMIADARAKQAERRRDLLLARLTAFESVGVELLAGNPAAAVEFGEEGCRLPRGARFGEIPPAASAHPPRPGALRARSAGGRRDDDRSRSGASLERGHLAPVARNAGTREAACA